MTRDEAPPCIRQRPRPKLAVRLAGKGSPLLRSRSSSIQAWPDSIAAIEGHEAAKFVRAADAMLWGKVYSTALILQRAVRPGLMTPEEAKARVEAMDEGAIMLSD